MSEMSEIEDTEGKKGAGNQMSFVLGVTGGIATGKTTVVEIFRKFDFPVVDGDVVARKVVEPGRPCLTALTEYFGSVILMETGELDRKKLAGIVFTDKEKRNTMNELMDTYIRQEIIREIEEGKKVSPLVIVDVPLLFERNYQQYMDAVAVVYISADLQLQRLMARNQYTKSEALQRIESQMPIEEKKRLADLVIDNQGTIAETEAQVISWLRKHDFIR